MAEIEEIKIAVVCNTTQANNSIRSLKEEIGECTTAISGLTTAAGSCSTALDQLAAAQERLNEVNEEAETATANLTDAHEELEEAIGDIIKGFNAFKSASALLGIENEALNSTLDKLQAGLELVPQLTAITNGIGAVQTAFSAFGRILSGHPIFVLAAVITGITTAMVYMIDYSSNLLSGVDDLKEGHQDYVDTLQTQQDEQEFLIRKMKAQGDSQKDVIAANREFTQQTLDDVGKRVKAINAEIEVLKAQTSWCNFAKKKRLKELESQSEELTQLFEQTNEKLIQLDKDYEIAEIKENAEKKKNRKANAKREKEREEKHKKELLEADKNLHKQRTDQSIAYQKQILSDDKLISFIEAQIKANDDLIESYNKVINDPEASIEAKIEATNRLMEAERESQALNEELLATEKQANEDRIQFEKELRIAQGFDGDLSQEELEELKKKETEEEIARLHDIAYNTTLSYEERAKALVEYNKLRDEQRKEQQKEEEEEVERQEEFENEKLELRSSFLSEASEMLGEHTVAGKAAAVAAATIDTYKAGTLALASSPPPFSYVALATTIATGLATVKNILSTKVPNATDTTSAASASVALPSMPENMGEIVETHNNMDSYDQEFLNSNRAVLVVENFNSVDSRINVAESKATY